MRIAVVPGDGIGVDVTREAVKVVEEVSRRRAPSTTSPGITTQS
jgi:isocitrate/isopropylmalate dehydrogenase